MPRSKDDLIKTLERQLEEKKYNRRLQFDPYPRQREFLNATKDYFEVGLAAGNQEGKSLTNAYGVSLHLTGGPYPDWFDGRRWDKPIRSWCLSETTALTRDVFQRLLLGTPGDPTALGTGMLPRDSIISTTLAAGAGGGTIDTARIKHSSGGTSEVSFRSYDQGRERLQGATLDLAAFDEEPKLDVYQEVLARTIATRGVVTVGFTPLSGQHRVWPRFHERTPEALRDRILIKMNFRDAKHLEDPAARARLMAMYPAQQARARLEGLPLMGSSMVFDTPLEALLVRATIGDTGGGHMDVLIDGKPVDTRAWRWLWSVDFGISERHAFGATLLGHDLDTDTIYVMKEIKMFQCVPAQHAHAMKMIGANVRVAWPHDGSQHDKGSGTVLADFYRREGLIMCPDHATFKTGGYSFEAGIAEMDTRMKSGRFKISNQCREFQDEYSGYHRDDNIVVKENDDVLSACRIGCMAIREARPAVLGGRRAINRGQQPHVVPYDDPFGD